MVQPGEEAAAGPTGSHPTNRCRLRELAPSSTRCRWIKRVWYSWGAKTNSLKQPFEYQSSGDPAVEIEAEKERTIVSTKVVATTSRNLHGTLLNQTHTLRPMRRLHQNDLIPVYHEAVCCGKHYPLWPTFAGLQNYWSYRKKPARNSKQSMFTWMKNWLKDKITTILIVTTTRKSRWRVLLSFIIDNMWTKWKFLRFLQFRNTEIQSSFVYLLCKAVS